VQAHASPALPRFAHDRQRPRPAPARLSGTGSRSSLSRTGLLSVAAPKENDFPVLRGPLRSRLAPQRSGRAPPPPYASSNLAPVRSPGLEHERLSQRGKTGPPRGPRRIANGSRPGRSGSGRRLLRTVRRGADLGWARDGPGGPSNRVRTTILQQRRRVSSSMRTSRRFGPHSDISHRDPLWAAGPPRAPPSLIGLSFERFPLPRPPATANPVVATEVGTLLRRSHNRAEPSGIPIEEAMIWRWQFESRDRRDRET